MRRALAIALFLICAHIHAADETTAPAVRTESMEVFFDPVGAVPIRWRIIDPEYVSAPVELIAPSERMPEITIPQRELAQFFETAKYEFTPFLQSGRLGMTFRSPRHASGLVLTKSYLFAETGFAGELRLEWENTSDSTVTLGDADRGPGFMIGPGLDSLPERQGLSGTLYSYTEPIYRSVDGIGTIRLSEDKSTDGISGQIKWAGLHSRYFLFALIPTSPTGHIASATAIADPFNTQLPYLEIATTPLTLKPAENVTRSYAIYAGPKDRAALKQAPGELDDILFRNLWNWMRALCFGLLWLLTKLYAVLHNWGLALIGLAVVVRIVLFPIAQSGLKAQAQLNADQARIKPLLEKVKQEHKGDAIKEHEETMKIYKAHGMSPYAPLKGCMWVFIQLPVLIALFQLIGHAYPLRQAHFLWISDLSQPDRLFELGFTIPLMGHSFNLLPVLMAVTQALTIRFTSSGGGQRGTMLALTIFFFVLFYSFPSGLMLYWMASNLLQVAQQMAIKPAVKTPALSNGNA